MVAPIIAGIGASLIVNKVMEDMPSIKEDESMKAKDTSEDNSTIPTPPAVPGLPRLS